MTDEQYTDIAIEISRNVKYPYVKMGKKFIGMAQLYVS